jgi:hypothetical protein
VVVPERHEARAAALAPGAVAVAEDDAEVVVPGIVAVPVCPPGDEDDATADDDADDDAAADDDADDDTADADADADADAVEDEDDDDPHAASSAAAITAADHAANRRPPAITCRC